MAASTLLPERESLELAELIADEVGFTMVVRACRPTACCPDCGVPTDAQWRAIVAGLLTRDSPRA